MCICVACIIRDFSIADDSIQRGLTCTVHVQCGWCRAITKSSSSTHSYQTSRCMQCAGPFFSYAGVTVVVCLITSVMMMGYCIVLPQIFQAKILIFHRLIVLAMCFNIIFNFIGCSLRSPGVPSPSLPMACDPEDGVKGVPEGFYNNYKYCYICEKPKPPDAHHCKICSKCVLDMDHHCPFIGNCVGRANLRSFLVFLAWIMIACTYAVMVTGTVVLSRLGAFTISKAKFHGPQILRLSMLDMSVVPTWYLLTIYIFAVSLGCAIGVGILLSSQLVQVSKGQNYIASLKGAPAEDKGTAYAKMKRVCGGRSPLFWMLPFWGKAEQYRDFRAKIS